MGGWMVISMRPGKTSSVFAGRILRMSVSFRPRHLLQPQKRIIQSKVSTQSPVPVDVKNSQQ